MHKTILHSLDTSVDWTKFAQDGKGLKGLSLPPVDPGLDHVFYCDGACSGNPGPGGWGVAQVQAERPGVYFHNGGAAATTNNQMELTAALESLLMTEQGSRSLVYTDSQYVVKGCTEWRRGWERNGMRNSKQQPVLNASLWLQLWAAIDERRVRLQWVRGHNGDPGNEAADLLAVQASRLFR